MGVSRLLSLSIFAIDTVTISIQILGTGERAAGVRSEWHTPREVGWDGGWRYKMWLELVSGATSKTS